MNTTQQSPLTHHQLKQFSGDLERYRTVNRDVIYTPGVKFVADCGGAYWLIDAIVSYFGSSIMHRAIAKDDRLSQMQFWRLDVRPNHSAVLTARADSGEPPFILQDISYTDFPLERIDIWAGFDGVRWTLYLPSEH